MSALPRDDEEVGDRATTPSGSRARAAAQVIGEGANLGAPSAGASRRRAGVRLNTDAIDNSAGVNTSTSR
jgi:glutamate dehydrogenase